MRYGRSDTSIPVYSCVEYSPIAQRVLLASKEDGLAHADILILESTRYSLRFFQREIGVGALVPIPSRRSVSRKRGREVISDLVERICTTNNDGDIGTHSQSVLSHIRPVRDQTLLSHTERERNLHGALAVLPAMDEYRRGSVILIDDLVTSGATLLEAARALRISGFDVLGAVTACVSQPLR